MSSIVITLFSIALCCRECRPGGGFSVRGIFASDVILALGESLAEALLDAVERLAINEEPQSEDVFDLDAKL
jgi:hypothetical protein